MICGAIWDAYHHAARGGRRGANPILIVPKKKEKKKKKRIFPKTSAVVATAKVTAFHAPLSRPSVSLSLSAACLPACERACVRRVCFGRSWEVKSIDALGWLLLPLSVRAHCPHPPDTFVDFFFLLLQSLFGIFCLLKSSSACLFTQARSSPSTRQIEAFVSLCSVTASNVRARVPATRKMTSQKLARLSFESTEIDESRFW